MSTLHEKVKAELANIEEVISALSSIDTSRTITKIETAGIAAYLHSFYNGIENILKQIFINYSWEIPQSESWHKDLLSEALKHKVVSESLKKKMIKFLGFRHFFIHNYGFKLDISELNVLLEDLPFVIKKFKSDIKKWIE